MENSRKDYVQNVNSSHKSQQTYRPATFHRSATGLYVRSAAIKLRSSSGMAPLPRDIVGYCGRFCEDWSGWLPRHVAERMQDSCLPNPLQRGVLPTWDSLPRTAISIDRIFGISM